MHKGFTLIEIVVVTVIISFVGILSGTNYISQREKTTLQSTAEQIKAQILQARTDAIKGRFKQNTIVQITNGTPRCLYIGVEKATINCANDAYPLPGQITITHPNNQRVTFDLISGDTSLNTAHFFTDGSGRGLELRSRQFIINIWISPTGVVSNSEAQHI